MTEKELYEQGKTIYEIAQIQEISPTGVWKRLKSQGVEMRKGGTPKGSHWAIKIRGTEFLGADGRWWIRGINSSGRRNSKRRSIVVMEQIIGGPIPKGYFVHHKNEDVTDDSPDNLELKKNGDHTKDHHMGKSNPSKGHSRDHHPMTILSTNQVLEVVSKYRTGGYSQKRLANEYGVHQTTISNIVRNY